MSISASELWHTVGTSAWQTQCAKMNALPGGFNVLQWTIFLTANFRSLNITPQYLNLCSFIYIIAMFSLLELLCIHWQPTVLYHPQIDIYTESKEETKPRRPTQISSLYNYSCVIVYSCFHGAVSAKNSIPLKAPVTMSMSGSGGNLSTSCLTVHVCCEDSWLIFQAFKTGDIM